MLEDFRQNRLSGTATIILSALKARGIAGATSLELGCGVGGLTLRLLREGVTSAKGIDLSPKIVDAARSLVAEEGFSGSVTFEVGDGATTPLSKAELVMFDAVICCYPDFPALIGNSSAAAHLYYGLFLPDDSRIATRLLSLILPLQALLHRRDTARFFIHSKKKVVTQLEKSGFRRVSETTTGWIWCVLVFAAPPG